MTPDELRAIRERATTRNADFFSYAEEDIQALLDEVEQLQHEFALERNKRIAWMSCLNCGTTRAEGDFWTNACPACPHEERERNGEASAEVERLTRERDSARDVILEYSTALAERDAEIVHLTNERDELLVRVANADAELRATRGAYNEAVRERDDAFLKCKAWMKADAEQARSYGLTHQGIRKMVHDYLDDEMSFGKLVELIRGAAKAMAEEQLSGKPGGFEP